MLRRARLFRASVLAGAFALLLPIGSWSERGSAAPAPPPSAATGAQIDVGAEIADFYRDRAFRPLWVDGGALRPEAGQALAMLAGSAADTPELRAALEAARSGDAHRLTRADLLMSQAYVAFVRARQRMPAQAAMRYIDDGLAPAPQSPRALLEEAAEAPSLARHLDAVARINPVLDGLRRALPGYRDPAQRRLIEANIERARAIPARPHGRYILVDAASAQLWMIEDGRIVDRMRVIVGKRAMPTPVMAGLIRYAMLNPYWNLPPDLIRTRARGGARAIAAEHLEVLSDWSPGARRLDPRSVDWRAVAAGRRLVNLRQTPGAHNMMGRVKFMLPNDLGVYLHDTPLRALFAGADRRQSSGCVRLEDAGRLERWLFRGQTPHPDGSAEQRVDLPEAVPVYIAYFTALPHRGGIQFVGDPYGRDGGSGVSAASRRPRQTRRA